MLLLKTENKVTEKQSIGNGALEAPFCDFYANLTFLYFVYLNHGSWNDMIQGSENCAGAQNKIKDMRFYK